uniref:TraG-D_C domain-containing protein n=1 Tax=Elaeophora elaphi TaxID=1147741 RepID=A0A0R3RP86_9BILA
MYASVIFKYGQRNGLYFTAAPKGSKDRQGEDDPSTTGHFAYSFQHEVFEGIIQAPIYFMDKLYALMTMAYKYQLQLCNGPENIVFITLNHLDCIRGILPEDKKLSQFLDVAHRMDSRINVSLFLREKKQTEEGRFVLFPEPNYQLLYNGSPPGKVRYFETNGEVRSESFPPDDNATMYKPCICRGNVELNRNDRGTTLGTNMYVSPESWQVKSSGMAARLDDPLPDDELRLLSALIISPEQDQQKGFDLNLFTDEMEEETFLQERDKALTSVTHIDARKHRKTIIAAVADVNIQ